jgi:hypothetical protein
VSDTSTTLVAVEQDEFIYFVFLLYLCENDKVEESPHSERDVLLAEMEKLLILVYPRDKSSCLTS